MKSKILGLGANLALALLTVGFTFTSCYDSANENVVVPSTPGETEIPAPVYEVTGYVTDFVTGAALQGATVVTPIGSASTDGTGFYKVTSATPANGTVTFSAVGYTDLTVNVSMTEIKTGLASYTASASLKKDGYIDGVEKDVIASAISEAAVTGLATELVNNDDVAKVVEVSLLVSTGAKWSDLLTRADLDDFVGHIKAVYGCGVGESFLLKSQTFSITLPARTRTSSVNVETMVATESYVLPGSTQLFVIDRVLGHRVTPNYVSIDHGHGHDTSHGHGNGGNAGGGITVAE